MSDSMPAPETPFAGATDPDYRGLDLIDIPIWVFDIDRRRIHWANRSAVRFWRADTLEQLQRRDFGADMSEMVAQRLAQYQLDFCSSEASFYEQWTVYPGDNPVSVNLRLSGHRLECGRVAMLCEALSTVDSTPDSVRSVEALLHTPTMITLYDTSGRALYRNPAARAAVLDPSQTLRQHLGSDETCAELIAELDRCGLATLTLAVKTHHGECWHEISARSCRDAVTGNSSFLLSEADVTQLKHSEAQASFLALHDSLTSLPNRSHLRQLFAKEVPATLADDQQAALLVIDLDEFKNVNDTLGHAAGDELLVEVAHRLRLAAAGDVLARFGGDEFLILVRATDIERHIEGIEARIRRLVCAPIMVQGSRFRVTASVGVAVYPRDGEDFESLLRSADLALYAAKASGRDALVYYQSSMSASMRARTELEGDLREALANESFEVHFQPIVAVADGCIVGAEALVRWRHPQRGLVTPSDFISACESTGLIRALGRQVFRQAARQRAAWARAGFPLLVSINMSPREFTEPGVVADLAAALAETGCDPAGLQIEITESVLLGTDDSSLDTLQAIAELGLSIALDDFGTGYSNLGYLRRYPISALKIDRSFIQGLADDRPLTELIVQLCRLMHLKAVAEGVETVEQLAWVRSQGIEFYQGYLFAAALPAAELSARLHAQRPALVESRTGRA